MIITALMLAGCSKSSENKVQTTNSTNTSAGKNYSAANEYKADVNQSIVTWLGKKVTGQHNGTVKVSEGSIYLNDNKVVGGVVKVDIRTLSDADLTDADSKKKLETHLKSDDFFNAEKFPFATFVINSVEPSTDPAKPKYIVKGDLTIRDVTKGVSFPSNINIDGNTVTADINADIDRTDFGLKYGSGKFFESLGDKAISDIFNIQIKVVARK